MLSSQQSDLQLMPAAPERPRVELPANVIPRHYDLTLRPDLATFISQGQVIITLDVAANSTSITLNALDIQVNAAKLVAGDGAAPVDAEGDPVYNLVEQTVTLCFPAHSLCVGSRGVKLILDFTGEINSGMMGFYRCKYSEGDGKDDACAKYAAATQFEATFARAALPCFDEPKYKTTFDVTIVVDKHLTALSNGDVVSRDPDPADAGKKVVKFERTPAMSTYLLAWAIGEFEYIEAYTRPTPALPDPVRCRVYTTKGLVHRGQFALALATNLLELFSDMFAIPYPLRKCDQVCVHEFACFAMENWGVVMYRDIALLLDTAAEGPSGRGNSAAAGTELASEQAKMMVATTVAHEFSHQWFGNLVTFTEFDDLWLNEGFATWVGTYGTALMYPQWDVWTQFVSDDFSFALRIDGYRSSHPVQVRVVDPKEIEEIFDDVSYSKGSSVIRMLAEWLGPDTFLTGIRAYLRQYAYQNTTTEDLYRILSETSGQDVSSVMGVWTRKVGYPVLTLSESGRLTQRRFLHTGRTDEDEDDDSTIWPLPLNIALVLTASDSTDQMPRPSTTVLSRELMVDKHLDLRILETSSMSPPLFVINSDRIGLYRVAYPPAHLRSLAHAAAQGRLSVRDRLGLVDDAFNLARAGDIQITEYLTLLAIMIPNERDLVVVKEAARGIGALSQVVRTAVETRADMDVMRAFRAHLFGSHVDRLGFDPVPGEDALVRLLRPLVVEQVGLAGGQHVIREAQRRFELLLEGGGGEDGKAIIAPDMYKVVFSLVVANGGEQAWQHVFDLYQSSSLADIKFGALYALGQATDETLVLRTLALAIDTDVVRQQDIDHVFTSVSENPTHRSLLWSFLKSNWPLIFTRYDAQAGILAQCISNATIFATTDRDLADIKAFFEYKDTSSFVRTLNEVCERALAMTLWVKRQGKDAVSWLRQWNVAVENKSQELYSVLEGDHHPSIQAPLSA
ncbi:peptidase family M1-domain-containing protein [Catenaria anguillulae PL171]|uniref:Aminopeptidase n=1 Tax=Catenaria anguillulae PL171 TaxID=765915 RepID=A0A1Y2HVN4_9FUNG|nr:peptidase family M1-domain-containing protein [Catenaria anguillulae PL171]